MFSLSTFLHFEIRSSTTPYPVRSASQARSVLSGQQSARGHWLVSWFDMNKIIIFIISLSLIITSLLAHPDTFVVAKLPGWNHRKYFVWTFSLSPPQMILIWARPRASVRPRAWAWEWRPPATPKPPRLWRTTRQQIRGKDEPGRLTGKNC